MLLATYGENWTALFRRFDREPIGSGCIAQVNWHRILSRSMPCVLLQVFKAEVDPVQFERHTGTTLIRRFHNQPYVPVAVKVF